MNFEKTLKCHIFWSLVTVLIPSETYLLLAIYLEKSVRSCILTVFFLGIF